MKELIVQLKFRDELLLSNSFLNSLGIKVSNDYENEAKTWVENSFQHINQKNEKNRILFKPITNKGLSFYYFDDIDPNYLEIVESSLQNMIEELGILFIEFDSFNNEKRFLFEKNDIKSFNKHDFDNRDGKVIDKPNFFNWFEIVFETDKLKTEKLLKLINDYGFLLPNEDFTNLLDFMYIKADIAEANNRINGENWNQDYLCHMGMNNHIKNNWIHNIQIGIIEKNKWNLNHSQLVDLSCELIFPSTDDVDLFLKNSNDEFSQHGNSTLGVLGAEHTLDLNLPVGIVPKAKYNLCSCTDKNNQNYFLECATWEGIFKSQNGDIILFEIQLEGDFPIEYNPVIYSLLVYANSKNIIVVEPAGNKGKDVSISNNLQYFKNLSKNQFKPIKPYLNKFSSEVDFRHPQKRNFRRFLAKYPSGAILVGSYYLNNTSNKFLKNPFSNFGDNIKLYAQGHDVYTTGSLNYKSYTATSAASAIMAGFIGLVQLYLMENYNTSVGPEKLLESLNNNGFPILNANGVGEVGLCPIFKEVVGELTTVNNHS